MRERDMPKGIHKPEPLGAAQTPQHILDGINKNLKSWDILGLFLETLKNNYNYKLSNEMLTFGGT